VTPVEETVREGEEVLVAQSTDRGLTVAFTQADLDHHTRPPVSRERAETAWESLTTPQPTGEDLSPEQLATFTDILATLDFEATVEQARRLYATEIKGMPARIVIAVEFEKMLCSELAYCLDRPYDELRETLRSADKSGSLRQAG
jgi:hypothetical protein